jgi:dihydropteroate synthase
VAPGIYIQPCAPFSPLPGAGTGAPALFVAGSRRRAFSAALRITRAGAAVERRLVSADDILADATIPSELLARLTAPRGALAGLALERPRLMGIVNVTPDSFSEVGRHLSPPQAIAHALRLAAEGADILDIGAESTRPGAGAVAVDDELDRVLPVIEGLRGRTACLLSIDTRKAEVMRRAAAAGVDIINDVSALSHDPAALAAAAQTGLPVVLMHSQGDPLTMQDNPAYADVVLDVYDALEGRLAACERAGIPRARVVVDPGIGFGKTLAHNLTLLGALGIFHGLGCALMLGASRKSFIGHLTGADAGARLPGSLAAALAGVAQGVQILRVHDVAATRQAVAVWEGAGALGG